MEPDKQMSSSLLLRVAASCIVAIASFEVLAALCHEPKGRRLLQPLVRPFFELLEGYRKLRTELLDRPATMALALIALAVGSLPALWVYRTAYLWFHNVFKARLMGTATLDSQEPQMARSSFCLMEQIGNTKAPMYFLGLDSLQNPVTISEEVLCAHVHVQGPTGTGKTKSVLFPLLAQDMSRGKGAAFIEPKGDYESIRQFKSLAALLGRQDDVKIFSLPFAGQCHSFNPVFVGSADNPLSVAERVFCDFEMDNSYYRGQSKQLFYNLVRAFAGTGKPFSLIDLRIAIMEDEALHYVLEKSDEKRAKHAIGMQFKALGRKRHETFTGLCDALSDFDPGGDISAVLNSYAPDIVMQDVINGRQLAYFHLPTNAYPLLGKLIGRLMLRQISAVGAARVCFPEKYDQEAFSVTVDECHEFVFETLLKALTMLRSAKMQFRLANQTAAQFEIVDKSYETIVRTNCRTKAIFQCEDPAQIETICRSLGTETTFKKTVRFEPGHLWTHKNTHEASSREVQQFIIHPDALKNLAPAGQAFVVRQGKAVAVSLAMLPDFVGGLYPLNKRAEAGGLDLQKIFIDRRAG